MMGVLGWVVAALLAWWVWAERQGHKQHVRDLISYYQNGGGGWPPPAGDFPPPPPPPPPAR